MKPNDSAYGYQELRNLYQCYMSWALSIAVSIQILLIGGYHFGNWLESRNESSNSEGRIRIRIIDVLPPPPPLDNRIETIAIATIPPKLAIGMPVPVPDFQADPEMEFATAKDLADDANRRIAETGILEAGDKLVIPPDPDEPSPDRPSLFEQPPRIILSERPEYPEIARRINLEGSSFVKVLVDKEGKVKKALLIKASDEIFAQPALDAAMKWAFTPALMNGKPVPVWVAIPFHFRLTQ
jgi:protein TonB